MCQRFPRREKMSPPMSVNWPRGVLRGYGELVGLVSVVRAEFRSLVAGDGAKSRSRRRSSSKGPEDKIRLQHVDLGTLQPKRGVRAQHCPHRGYPITFHGSV